MKAFFTSLSLALIALSTLKSFAQPQSISSTQAPDVNGSITVGEWSGAKVFTKFYQFIPEPDGTNKIDSTVVFVKQDKDALYFAFDYYPTGKIISKSVTRDRSTEDENEFFILLDMENKNQNGYVFSFSFLNNQRDAAVYNVRNKSYEWDWIWDVRSTIIREAAGGKPGHIQTEVEIPVGKMQNKNKKQIGIDFQLFSYKPDGNYYYYSIIPNSELLSVKNMYKFDLVTPFEDKLNLDIAAIPFGVAQSFNDEGDTLRIGGDLNAAFENHKLKATLNPDESTLEADPFRFSLYARPIFLQEKRPFFSKDLDIYRTPINLFYTRAIEDIRYGLNYTYRSDLLKAGATYVADFDPDGNRREFFVARPNLNFKNSTLGGMFIRSLNNGTLYRENIVSFDGFYRFPENPLRFGAQFVNSWNSVPGREQEGSAYNLYGFYQYNDAGGPFADFGYNRVNRGFQASTSFNSQIGLENNFDEVYASGGYHFAYDRKYFSDINVSGGYYRGRILHGENGMPDNFKLQNRWSQSLNFKLNDIVRINQYFEYNTPNDFDENGNLITRENFAQDYSANFYVGETSFYTGYYFGPYFGDFIKNPYFGADIFLFSRLSVGASLNYIDLFDTKRTIINTRIDWRVFDKFYVRSYYQKDSFTKTQLWNSIFQYEFFAGSNVYLVFNLNGEKLENTRKYFKVAYEFTF
ncbi:MAG: hypothetical protein K1X85_06065 [Ignavibacteria bacterium]|nr:hypothetical protein [Ignavibacteria bacterium]